MDIRSREDIELLVKKFYEKVVKDEVIGLIFNEVMQVDWPKHLPTMYDFWETILLDAEKYSGNTMGIHFEVNRKIKLETKHFDRWLQLFFSTIDELFSGDIADLAKKRAKSIASLMQFKMQRENEGLPISPKLK